MLAVSASLITTAVRYEPVLTTKGDTLSVPKYGSCDEEFAIYVKEFGKEKENSAFRRDIFCENLKFIEEHNRLNVVKDGYFLKVGPHTDRLDHEVATGGLNITDFVGTDMREDPGALRASHVDWRSRMPAVKNQQ